MEEGVVVDSPWARVTLRLAGSGCASSVAVSTLHPGALVWAKERNFPWWPARVLRHPGPGMVRVVWLGWAGLPRSSLPAENVLPFDFCRVKWSKRPGGWPKHRHTPSKWKSALDAVGELEAAAAQLGRPVELVGLDELQSDGDSDEEGEREGEEEEGEGGGAEEAEQEEEEEEEEEVVEGDGDEEKVEEEEEEEEEVVEEGEEEEEEVEEGGDEEKVEEEEEEEEEVMVEEEEDGAELELERDDANRAEAPPGWRVLFKERKRGGTYIVYIDPDGGHSHSKKQAWVRYGEAQGSDVEGEGRGQGGAGSSGRSDAESDQTDDAELLRQRRGVPPPGWALELSAGGGKRYRGPDGQTRKSALAAWRLVDGSGGTATEERAMGEKVKTEREGDVQHRAGEGSRPWPKLDAGPRSESLRSPGGSAGSSTGHAASAAGGAAAAPARPEIATGDRPGIATGDRPEIDTGDRLEMAIAAVREEHERGSRSVTMRLHGCVPAVFKAKKSRRPTSWPAEPESSEPLRNPDGRAITSHGFAECNGLLPAALCDRLACMPMTSAEGISNAFQKSVRGSLLKETIEAIEASPTIADAVRSVFGSDRFSVSNAKVLLSELGQLPQIPHADDFCNRELFGIIHLLPEQSQTEAMPYDAAAPYPSGVLALCGACGAWCELPDCVARRREHLDAPGRELFTCAKAGLQCSAAQLVSHTMRASVPASPPKPSPPTIAPGRAVWASPAVVPETAARPPVAPNAHARASVAAPRDPDALAHPGASPAAAARGSTAEADAGIAPIVAGHGGGGAATAPPAAAAYAAVAAGHTAAAAPNPSACASLRVGPSIAGGCPGDCPSAPPSPPQSVLVAEMPRGLGSSSLAAHAGYMPPHLPLDHLALQPHAVLQDSTRPPHRAEPAADGSSRDFRAHAGPCAMPAPAASAFDGLPLVTFLNAGLTHTSLPSPAAPAAALPPRVDWRLPSCHQPTDLIAHHAFPTGVAPWRAADPPASHIGIPHHGVPHAVGLATAGYLHPSHQCSSLSAPGLPLTNPAQPSHADCWSARLLISEAHVPAAAASPPRPRFRCEEPGCDKDFVRRDNMRRHMRRIHKAESATGGLRRLDAGGSGSLESHFDSPKRTVDGDGGGFCGGGAQQAAGGGAGACGASPLARAVAGPADGQAGRYPADLLLDEILEGVVDWGSACAFENLSAARTASPAGSDVEEPEQQEQRPAAEGEAGAAAMPPADLPRQPHCQPPFETRYEPPCQPPGLPADQPSLSDDWLINRQSSHAKYYGGEGSHRRADLAKLNTSAGEDGFARDLVAAFGHLLWRPAGVVRQMRPCGAPPNVGDGIVCLPTLVHRGPGGNEEMVKERKVLFFSVKPIYAGFHCADGDVGEYDAEAQIHAGWLLWRTSHILEEPEEVLRGYEEVGYSLLDFGKGEKLRYRDGAGRKKRKRVKESSKTPAAMPAGMGGSKTPPRLAVVPTIEQVPADTGLAGASADAGPDGAPARDEQADGLGASLDNVGAAATMPLPMGAARGLLPMEADTIPASGHLQGLHEYRRSARHPR